MVSAGQHLRWQELMCGYQIHCGLVARNYERTRLALPSPPRPHTHANRASRPLILSFSLQESNVRRHYHAYIRKLRGSFEGSKSVQSLAWFTGKRTLEQRWTDYSKHRTSNGLPVLGSKHTFFKVWKDHKEIIEMTSQGHPICDTCGHIQIERDRLEGRHDAWAVDARRGFGVSPHRRPSHRFCE